MPSPSRSPSPAGSLFSNSSSGDGHPSRAPSPAGSLFSDPGAHPAPALRPPPPLLANPVSNAYQGVPPRKHTLLTFSKASQSLTQLKRKSDPSPTRDAAKRRRFAQELLDMANTPNAASSYDDAHSVPPSDSPWVGAEHQSRSPFASEVTYLSDDSSNEGPFVEQTLPRPISPIRTDRLLKRTNPVLALSFRGEPPIQVALVDASPSDPALTFYKYTEIKHLSNLFPTLETVVLAAPPPSFEIGCEGGPHARLSLREDDIDIVLAHFEQQQEPPPFYLGYLQDRSFAPNRQPAIAVFSSANVDLCLSLGVPKDSPIIDLPPDEFLLMYLELTT